MNRLIAILLFLILTGCTDSLIFSHHSTLPLLSLPEQGDPVKAGSFTLAGSISYLHDTVYQVSREDSLALPGVKNLTEAGIGYSVSYLYYPRLQFAGKWGYNPSRYFTIGLQGSMGTLFNRPETVADNMTNLSGTAGVWMRVGGPLAGNPNISIAGSISQLAGFTPSYYRTFGTDEPEIGSDTREVDASFIMEQSMVVQFRPHGKFGLFFGYAHLPFTSDYFDSFIHTYTGLGYGGVSLPVSETGTLSLRGGVQFVPAEELVQPRISLQWSSNRPIR